MGRIAGVSAAETRERLLKAAAGVFAERGYDGTRVSDIAAAAGVSNGAMYAHFTSKAELLAEALRAHGRRLLAEALAADPDSSLSGLLLAIGRQLPRRRDQRGCLIVEALVAARPGPRRPDARLRQRAGRLDCRPGAGSAGRRRPGRLAVARRARAPVPAAVDGQRAHHARSARRGR